MKLNRYSLIILIGAIIPSTIFSVAGTPVPNGSSVNITGDDAQCRTVTNTCGQTVFVGIKTTGEIAVNPGAKPGCVTIANCAGSGTWASAGYMCSGNAGAPPTIGSACSPVGEIINDGTACTGGPLCAGPGEGCPEAWICQ